MLALDELISEEEEKLNLVSGKGPIKGAEEIPQGEGREGEPRGEKKEGKRVGTCQEHKGDSERRGKTRRR